MDLPKSYLRNENRNNEVNYIPGLEGVHMVILFNPEVQKAANPKRLVLKPKKPLRVPK